MGLFREGARRSFSSPPPSAPGAPLTPRGSCKRLGGGASTCRSARGGAAGARARGRAGGARRRGRAGRFSCCQQTECTVGTWVGATVGRGGAGRARHLAGGRAGLGRAPARGAAELAALALAEAAEVLALLADGVAQHVWGNLLRAPHPLLGARRAVLVFLLQLDLEGPAHNARPRCAVRAPSVPPGRAAGGKSGRGAAQRRAGTATSPRILCCTLLLHCLG